MLKIESPDELQAKEITQDSLKYYQKKLQKQMDNSMGKLDRFQKKYNGWSLQLNIRMGKPIEKNDLLKWQKEYKHLKFLMNQIEFINQIQLHGDKK